MTTLPQPGWYDDPYDSNALCYWDGRGWTPHRQRKPLLRPGQAPPNFPTPQPPANWSPPSGPNQPLGRPLVGSRGQRLLVPIVVTAVIAVLVVAAVLVYTFGFRGDSTPSSSEPTGSSDAGGSTSSSSAPSGSAPAGNAGSYKIILNGQEIAQGSTAKCISEGSGGIEFLSDLEWNTNSVSSPDPVSAKAHVNQSTVDSTGILQVGGGTFTQWEQRQDMGMGNATISPAVPSVPGKQFNQANKGKTYHISGNVMRTDPGTGLGVPGSSTSFEFDATCP